MSLTEYAQKMGVLSQFGWCISTYDMPHFDCVGRLNVAPLVYMKNHIYDAPHIKVMVPMNPLSLFKCLGDETRLNIMILVQSQGELCVGELVDALALSQPKVSRHLASLRECQLLDVRKSGQWVFYRVHSALPAWANHIVCQAVSASEQSLMHLQSKLNLVNQPDRKAACC